MVVPTQPMATLKMIQAEFLFHFAIVQLDPPAGMGHAHQAPQSRDTRIQLGQPILDGLLFSCRPFDQQPLGDAWGRLPERQPCAAQTGSRAKRERCRPRLPPATSRCAKPKAAAGQRPSADPGAAGALPRAAPCGVGPGVGSSAAVSGDLGSRPGFGVPPSRHISTGVAATAGENRRSRRKRNHSPAARAARPNPTPGPTARRPVPVCCGRSSREAV